MARIITVQLSHGVAQCELEGDLVTVTLDGKSYNLKYDLDLDLYESMDVGLQPEDLDLVNKAIKES